VPSTSSSTSNIVTAALFGLLLSTALVLLIEYLDITVKSREDAEARLELPVLGIVPELPLDPASTRGRAETTRRHDLGLVHDA
jgi:capsular polysaccharide biosynthesis protein